MSRDVVSPADVDAMVAVVRDLHAAAETVARGGVPTRAIAAHEAIDWDPKTIETHLRADTRVEAVYGFEPGNGPLVTWTPVETADGGDESGSDDCLLADGGVATHPYAPTDLGVATVDAGSCCGDRVGLRYTVPAAAIRALGEPVRVSVVERAGEWLLVPGVCDDAVADYAVTRGSNSLDCRVSTRGCDALGLAAGDRVRHHAADDGVRLELLSVAPDGGRVTPRFVFVDAFPDVERDQCQHWHGLTPGSRCGAPATHTVVVSGPDGETHLALCDACGRPATAEMGPETAIATDGGDQRD